MVKSLKDLNNVVLKDCIGTVVMVYAAFPPAYEVEFVNDAFGTIDVLTVKADDIIKVKQ